MKDDGGEYSDRSIMKAIYEDVVQVCTTSISAWDSMNYVD
jgi:hypothetical protein